MELDFNPEDVAGKSEVAQGVYSFSVESVQQRQFGTGTKGCTVVLDVFLDDRAIKVYENMYYTPKALWKIKDLCNAVGAPWPEKGNRLDTRVLLGKSGRAFFGRQKGDKYLKVIDFIDPNKKKSEADSNNLDSRFGKTPFKSVPEEDVPF